ncbi:MAG: hypothetical protein SWY16_21715 [Cyanobacteriota bacterium]|nr:hypothetical protein [Cyanobacteriota bacterium]
MSYVELLHPWCIVRSLPNARYSIVARFRRRNDAAAHRQALERLLPNLTYQIVYDPCGLPSSTNGSPKPVGRGTAR